MALFRRFFYRKPPDQLLEITERVYVFDCCFSTHVPDEGEFRTYMNEIVAQLRNHFPEGTFMVLNFKDGDGRSLFSDLLAQYGMTVMDYPQQYERCPLLPMEMINHFLRSSENWLTVEGHHNILLMLCERGGWPVLAFMLAGLLLYRKQYTGEQKTLEMVYKQAPKDLLSLLTPLNPQPSQLRYLQYISRRNSMLDWETSDAPLALDCIILQALPRYDQGQGCRPIIRVYGHEFSSRLSSISTKLLFSSSKVTKDIPYYQKEEYNLVTIDIHCRVQGDVVLECIHLEDDLVSEKIIFRTMFHTEFVRENVLMLTHSEVDVLWDVKDLISREFKAEVHFSDAASLLPIITTKVVNKDDEDSETEVATPEEFFEAEEIFSSFVDVQDDMVASDDYPIEVSAKVDEDIVDEAQVDKTPVDEGHHDIPLEDEPEQQLFQECTIDTASSIRGSTVDPISNSLHNGEVQPEAYVFSEVTTDAETLYKDGGTSSKFEEDGSKQSEKEGPKQKLGGDNNEHKGLSIAHMTQPVYGTISDLDAVFTGKKNNEQDSPDVVARWIPSNKGSCTNSLHIHYPRSRNNSAPALLALDKDSDYGVKRKLQSAPASHSTSPWFPYSTVDEDRHDIPLEDEPEQVFQECTKNEIRGSTVDPISNSLHNGEVQPDAYVFSEVTTDAETLYKDGGTGSKFEEDGSKQSEKEGPKQKLGGDNNEHKGLSIAHMTQPVYGLISDLDAVFTGKKNNEQDSPDVVARWIPSNKGSCTNSMHIHYPRSRNNSAPALLALDKDSVYGVKRKLQSAPASHSTSPWFPDSTVDEGRHDIPLEDEPEQVFQECTENETSSIRGSTVDPISNSLHNGEVQPEAYVFSEVTTDAETLYKDDGTSSKFEEDGSKQSEKEGPKQKLGGDNNEHKGLSIAHMTQPVYGTISDLDAVFTGKKNNEQDSPDVVARWVPSNKGSCTNSMHIHYPRSRNNSAPALLSLDKDSVYGVKRKLQSAPASHSTSPWFPDSTVDEGRHDIPLEDEPEQVFQERTKNETSSIRGSTVDPISNSLHNGEVQPEAYVFSEVTTGAETLYKDGGTSSKFEEDGCKQSEKEGPKQKLGGDNNDHKGLSIAHMTQLVYGLISDLDAVFTGKKNNEQDSPDVVARWVPSNKGSCTNSMHIHYPWSRNNSAPALLALDKDSVYGVKRKLQSAPASHSTSPWFPDSTVDEGRHDIPLEDEPEQVFQECTKNETSSIRGSTVDPISNSLHNGEVQPEVYVISEVATNTETLYKDDGTSSKFEEDGNKQSEKEGPKQKLGGDNNEHKSLSIAHTKQPVYRSISDLDAVFTGKKNKEQDSIDVVARWIPSNNGSYTNSMHIHYPPSRNNSAPALLALDKDSVYGVKRKLQSAPASHSTSPWFPDSTVDEGRHDIPLEDEPEQVFQECTKDETSSIRGSTVDPISNSLHNGEVQPEAYVISEVATNAETLYKDDSTSSKFEEDGNKQSEKEGSKQKLGGDNNEHKGFSMHIHYPWSRHNSAPALLALDKDSVYGVQRKPRSAPVSHSTSPWFPDSSAVEAAAAPTSPSKSQVIKPCELSLVEIRTKHTSPSEAPPPSESLSEIHALLPTSIPCEEELSLSLPPPHPPLPPIALQLPPPPIVLQLPLPAQPTPTPILTHVPSPLPPSQPTTTSTPEHPPHPTSQPTTVLTPVHLPPPIPPSKPTTSPPPPPSPPSPYTLVPPPPPPSPATPEFTTTPTDVSPSPTPTSSEPTTPSPVPSSPSEPTTPSPVPSSPSQPTTTPTDVPSPPPSSEPMPNPMPPPLPPFHPLPPSQPTPAPTTPPQSPSQPTSIPMPPPAPPSQPMPIPMPPPPPHPLPPSQLAPIPMPPPPPPSQPMTTATPIPPPPSQPMPIPTPPPPSQPMPIPTPPPHPTHMPPPPPPPRSLSQATSILTPSRPPPPPPPPFPSTHTTTYSLSLPAPPAQASSPSLQDSTPPSLSVDSSLAINLQGNQNHPPVPIPPISSSMENTSTVIPPRPPQPPPPPWCTMVLVLPNSSTSGPFPFTFHAAYPSLPPNQGVYYLPRSLPQMTSAPQPTSISPSIPRFSQPLALFGAPTQPFPSWASTPSQPSGGAPRPPPPPPSPLPLPLLVEHLHHPLCLEEVDHLHHTLCLEEPHVHHPLLEEHLAHHRHQVHREEVHHHHHLVHGEVHHPHLDAPEFDASEIESLFCATAPGKDKGKDGAKNAAAAKPTKIQLIDLKRAYNVEIMLTKVKMSLPDLMTAVLSLDNTVLDADQVENLIKFCPKKEEMELLETYTGDPEMLGKCEQLSDFKESLVIVNSACEEVRNSEKLKEILQRILVLGNKLNEGTARGAAVGYKLDSLLKLTDTRSTTSKMTLMHFLCKSLAAKNPDLLEFYKDLPNLEASTKIQLKSLADEMTSISKGLEKVKLELDASEHDGPISEVFHRTLKEFIGSAESEVTNVMNTYAVAGKNAEAVAMYFGEDPKRIPLEQVTETLSNFVKLFQTACEENNKQAEADRKKAQKEAEAAENASKV
ncbi:hypothetical protein SASPL_151491 [Salvia splendens]|uniref:Formin-like protein n=1 Tax=Salvia splendens TaxID=180675 RepID=A0A8X8Z3F8_SALSN|nr:hypothetical protein SASPL_151491 [Salvia splendens]